MRRLPVVFATLVTAAALLLAGCTTAAQPAPPAPGGADQGPLIVYSGRNENLIGPLIERFREDTGLAVEVRYGDTAELAATILEEGDRSPADVYLAQDAGALGALAAAGRLAPLPDEILQRVDARFRDPDGRWVGLSGRARVVVYHTLTLEPEDLPDSIYGFTDPAWRGRIGWAPTNGSFQAFVTALRLTDGEEAARDWLEGIQANEPRVYANNTAIVQAVGAGEIEVGLVNHYYLYRFLAEEGEDFPARNYTPRAGGAGAMMNVAGAGVLGTSTRREAAEAFLRYMLSEDAQRHLSEETFEYPLASGVAPHPLVTPLEELAVPDIDLGSLADLEETLRLLQGVGVL